MGSTTSTAAGETSSPAPAPDSGSRRPLFSSSSCFHPSPKVEENGRSKDTSASGAESKSGGTNQKCCDVLAHHSKMPSVPSSDDEQSDFDHDSKLQSDTGASSSSITSTAIGSYRSRSGRLRSRFNFIPEGISFRLKRVVSLGSAQAHSLLSNKLFDPNGDPRGDASVDPDRSLDNISKNHCRTNLEMSPVHDISTIHAGNEATGSHYSNWTSLEHSHRRLGQQEPLEGSVRFSRTHSVGRLRDRVLRRNPLSEGLYAPSFSEDRPAMLTEHGSERQVLASGRTSLRSIGGNESLTDSPPHSQPGSSINMYDDPSSRHDLLEHRTTFLERRRRIRSQVRALQRLGSRFESLTGHDSSCILSGGHRTSSCTCRTSNRAANNDEETTTRASISRIVMLAEALFEVLDEIHQQSVVLSSRPSFSSIGSVPAPKELVESIPIKVYKRQTKTLEDAAQICPLCRGDVCTSEASNKQRVV